MPQSVYKVIELVGTSTKSWEEAAKAAVDRAAETLRDLRVAEVVAQDLVITDGKVEAYRETLAAAEPDVLVMVGADHFHQFFLDNYPTFLIGKQEKYDATFYNEEREFGLPTYLLDGLGVVHSDTVRLAFTTPARPALLVPISADDSDSAGDATDNGPGGAPGTANSAYRYLVMPARLPG